MLLTQFDEDPSKFEVISQCVQNYGVGNDESEWPNNILSKRAVVYQNGVIARCGESVQFSVDPAELSLCQRLSIDVASIMEGTNVGMGSESGDSFHAFYIVSNVGEESPSKIDDELIRNLFRGTIFPPAIITVEPLQESGIWWEEVSYDGSESESSYFAPWRSMIRWFHSQTDFVDSAFVRIGDNQDSCRTQRSGWPPGTECMGCVFPRLAVGLTRSGSLVGIFGQSVQT